MSALKPIKFEEANKNLLKPDSMTDEECGSLLVYSDGLQCVSCWGLTLRQRLAVLLHGRIWLAVLGGTTHPPVWLDCGKTVFIKEPKEDK